MPYEYLINFFNLWHIFMQQLFCGLDGFKHIFFVFGGRSLQKNQV